MVLKMSEIVNQFKRDWPKYLLPESIKELCKEINLDWRDRKLDPATTLHLMMLQLLEGDTAISHRPHLSGKRFSPAAFCKARLRLPLELFEKLAKRIAESIQQNDFNQERWFGHRVFIVDGTGVSMPEDPRLVKEFGYTRKRKDLSGFPVARLILKMHFGTGLISSVLINPFRSSESRECYRLHPELNPHYSSDFYCEWRLPNITGTLHLFSTSMCLGKLSPEKRHKAPVISDTHHSRNEV